MTKRHAHLKDRFVSLPYPMLDGEAWRDLSGYAAKVMIAICQRYNGKNNGHIPFSQSEAAAVIRKSKRTAMRVFEELKASGLLVEVQRGGMRYGADGKRVGVATTWRLAFYP